MLYDEDEMQISVVSVANITWQKHEIKVKRRPYSALSFRVRGEGHIKAAGSEVHIKEGEVLFLPQNMDYEAKYTDGEVLVIHFECKNRVFDKLEGYTFSDPKYIQPLFRRAYSAWQSKRAGYKLEITAIIYEVLLCAARQRAEAEVQSASFMRAIEILKTEFKNPELRISDVCQRAGISDSYLRRMTKSQYGMYPVRYLAELRVSCAENLMHHPSVSVESAAAESGFADPKYFARVVKKLRGCAPSELRIL